MLDAAIAQNEAQARNMWVIRESVAPASRAEGGGLSYDVSVSTSKVPAFIEQGLKAVLEILPSIRPYPLGHIGDGNIHFSFMIPVGMDRETLRQYSPAITRAVNDLVRDMTRHRHRQDRRARALPLQDRARPDARHQARAGSEEHHEPRQDPETLGSDGNRELR